MACWSRPCIQSPLPDTMFAVCSSAPVRSTTLPIGPPIQVLLYGTTTTRSRWVPVARSCWRIITWSRSSRTLIASGSLSVWCMPVERQPKDFLRWEGVVAAVDATEAAVHLQLLLLTRIWLHVDNSLQGPGWLVKASCC